MRKALQPGLTIRWGFPPHLAEFRIMKSRAIVTRIKKMGPLLAKQDPALVATLRANRYLASHLYYPAYREAEDALAAKPTAHACAVMQAALRGMGLENSKAADDLEERIAELPPDARAKAGCAVG